MSVRQLPEALRSDDKAPDARTLRVVLVVVLLLTVIGGGVDLVLDAPESWTSPHALYELALAAFAAGTMLWLWRGWWRSQLIVRRSRQAVDARFAAWGLTPVEREIASLLLAGRSHKQIAFATGRSERTVRQHAVAIYQKSGLAGRAELAAAFVAGPR
jgi:DNA-binding CsgD family transcriptional regulator